MTRTDIDKQILSHLNSADLEVNLNAQTKTAIRQYVRTFGEYMLAERYEGWNEDDAIADLACTVQSLPGYRC